MAEQNRPRGPVEIIVVALTAEPDGSIAAAIADKVEAGIIRILDLVFITKETDGSVTGIELADFDQDGQLDLAVFEGVSSGLIDEDDKAEAGKVLEPGSSAGILIYENVWAAPFAVAMRRSGGQLVASGRIPVQALLAAVDAAEARTGDSAGSSASV